ncbi:hypothetical protein CRG98_027833 [Punica granatum]|uniref:Uncharacterized protein n=1 Tax=Punica granatum TaxID=22663 RepID=A0A2I0J6B6_PUNGR|nr:hypothetical protein CRG98_027833 [Punica granatum]
MFHGTLKGAYYSHLMGHKSSFSEVIMAGKQVGLGIKLGRIEGPTKKKEKESSRKTTTAVPPTGNRRGKETSVNAVDSGHQGPQPYSMSFTPAPPTTPAYALPPVHYQPQHSAQLVYYSALLAPHPPSNRTGPRLREFLSRRSGHKPRRANKAVPHNPGRAYSSHPYRFHFPTYSSNFSENQSLHCEYHSGAPGHTTVNCWKLREEVQKMIDANKLSFNAVRPPNVQANPLPNHGSSSGPTINLISICTIGEDESKQDGPVGFTGSGAARTPFVIEVPAQEPYQDSKRHGSDALGVGVRELGGCEKGKALAAALRALSEATLIPQMKVTEEEAEAFMKIIKLPSEGWAHSLALHIVCKCNNFIISWVMIDNGSDLNVCPISTLKHMNVDLNHIRPSKTAVRAFDGLQREVNGEIDLLIDVDPWSFNVTFQTISIIRDNGEVGPIRVDCMVGKVILRHNYIPSTKLKAHGQEISLPIEVEEYKKRRGLGFRLSCHEIVQACSTSTVSPHTIGESIGACRFPHSPTSFQVHRTSSEAP